MTYINDHSGGSVYPSALVGQFETASVKVDVSALTTSQVDADGYLKPNVPLTLNGLSPTTASAVAQVETLTVAGTVDADGAGNAVVVVTSKLLVGGSKTFQVAVANDDTAAQVAAKVRAALGADADITGYYAVGGSSTTVTLTALSAGPNDETLNISIADGTSDGLTTVTTSTNTTAGVAGTASEIPCVTVEAVKVAANNGAGLATASDRLVACAVRGTLNRDVMEDVLGRALTAAEVASLRGPNSNLTLLLT